MESDNLGLVVVVEEEMVVEHKVQHTRPLQDGSGRVGPEFVALPAGVVEPWNWSFPSLCLQTNKRTVIRRERKHLYRTKLHGIEVLMSQASEPRQAVMSQSSARGEPDTLFTESVTEVISLTKKKRIQSQFNVWTWLY